MKTVFSLFFIVIMISACRNGNYTIHISNQSSRSFDSIRVLVNSSQGGSTSLLFTGVVPGQNVQQSINPSLFIAKHDIGIRPILYAKDTVIKNWGTYNDLGVFNLNYKLTIDSTLQQKWEMW
jgi:hypothetical protein